MKRMKGKKERTKKADLIRGFRALECGFWELRIVGIRVRWVSVVLFFFSFCVF